MNEKEKKKYMCYINLQKPQICVTGQFGGVSFA